MNRQASKLKKPLYWRIIIGLTLLLINSSCQDEESESVCFLASYSSEVNHVTYQYSRNKLISYTNENAINSFVYDELGNIIKLEIREIGSSEPYSYRDFTYDGNGRLISQSVYTEEALVQKIDYSYNTSGQVIMEEYFYDGEADPTNITTLEYKDTKTKNHFKEIIVTPSLTTTYLFYYDNHPTPYGNLTDPNAATNNVVKIEVQVNELSGTTLFAYKYNSFGYPIERMSSDGEKTEWTYHCK